MRASSAPPVVLVAPDPATRARAARAIRAAGATVHAVDDLDATPAARLAQAELVVLAWPGDAGVLEAVEERLPDGAQVVGLLPPVGLGRMMQLVTDSRCNHILIDDPATPAAAAPWLRTTIAKLLGGPLFGLGGYLAPPAQVRSAEVYDYAGRSRVLGRLLDSAETAELRSQLRSHIAGACDELMMNALYDAPIDARGQLVFGDVDIKQRLGQRSPRKVSIQYGGDAAGFAVAVRDSYGRLDKDTLLRNIEKCLRRPIVIDAKKHGAGLGLFLVLSAASHVVLNIAPGRCTEVICQFDRDGVRGGLRGLSIFVGDEEEAAGSRRLG